MSGVQLLTVEQAAERLCCSPTMVRRLVADGRLVGHQIGRLGSRKPLLRISEKGLEAFIDADLAKADKAFNATLHRIHSDLPLQGFGGGA